MRDMGHEPYEGANAVAAGRLVGDVDRVLWQDMSGALIFAVDVGETTVAVPIARQQTCD
jgi:hypothetical protein